MESKFRDALQAVSDDEVIKLESKLVSIPSYTSEEAELAEFIADFLNDEGVEVGLQRVSFADVPHARSPKSYNVIGRIHGRDGNPSLMFNGHMDHGPIGGRDADDLSRWSRPPFTPTVEDGFLYGKGCQDEKGGICAMLVAATAIKRARVPLKGDIVVAPVCGHKTFSRGSHHLVQSGIWSDMAINTENSGNGIVPLHVGVFKAAITATGAHPHPAIRWRYPPLRGAPTPFQQILKIIQALGPEATPYPDDSWLRFERHPVLKDFPWHHIEEIESKGASARVVHVWWRTPPGVTAETLRKDLEDLQASLYEGGLTPPAAVQVQAYGGALETAFDSPVVRSLARWHREIAAEEPSVGPEGRYGGYGDAAVLAAAGMQAVAYGPGGGLSDLDYEYRLLIGEVPPDERIPVKDLLVAARVSTAAAVDLLT